MSTDVTAREWRTLPFSAALPWVVLAATIAGAVWLFTREDVASIIVVVTAGVYVWGWADYAAGSSVTTPLATGLLAGAGAVLVKSTPLYVVLALVTIVGAVWVLPPRRRRVRAVKRLIVMCDALQSSWGGKAGEALSSFTPRWKDADGLPVSWKMQGVPVEKQRQKLNEIASEAMGFPVSISTDLGVALIERKKPEAAKDSLDGVSERINTVLARSLGEGAQVDSINRDVEGSIQEVRFSWPATLANRVASRPYRMRVETVLASAIGGFWNIEWDTTNDQGIIAPRAPLPNMIPNPGRSKTLKIPFAVYRGGRTAVWDLNSIEPHMLIAGGTGAGKTNLITTVLTSLPDGVDIMVCDPKRVSLKGIELLPSVIRYARDAEDMVAVGERVRAEVMDRYNKMEVNPRLDRTSFKRMVWVIEEGVEFARVVNDFWNQGAKKAAGGTGTEHPVMASLRSVVALGREAGVHVLLASQQVDAKWLSTEARGNFGLKVALGNLEPVGSVMLFGSPIAANGLEAIEGRAWVQSSRGAIPEHVQGYYTPKIYDRHSEFDLEILTRLGLPMDLIESFGEPIEDQDDARGDAVVDLSKTQPVALAPLSEPEGPQGTARVPVRAKEAPKPPTAAQPPAAAARIAPVPPPPPVPLPPAPATVLEDVEPAPRSAPSGALATDVSEVNAGGGGEADVEGDDGSESIPTPVLDLVVGQVVFIEGEPHALEDVEPDPFDEDALSLTLRSSATGELLVLGIEEGDSLPALPL